MSVFRAVSERLGSCQQMKTNEMKPWEGIGFKPKRKCDLFQAPRRKSAHPSEGLRKLHMAYTKASSLTTKSLLVQPAGATSEQKA